MTIRTTASLLLAASFVALATACGSAAGRWGYAPEPARGCRYIGPVSGQQVISRFADTTATAGTATEALDTVAALLRREGFTVLERAPGAAVVTRGAPAGWVGPPPGVRVDSTGARPWVGRPLGVRVDSIGARQIAFCALWGLGYAALNDAPEGWVDPAGREAVGLYQRIREAVLARR